MTAQYESPIGIGDSAAAPQIPKGQTAPIKAADVANDYIDRQVPNGTLFERFLRNLRIALSAPHA
jgi:hypothetical protein